MDGSGGGAQTTTQEFKPPTWTEQGWKDFVGGATEYASKPYEPYDGMKIAPINGRQQLGVNFLEDRALSGAPDLNAARGLATNLASGNFASPWAGNVSGLAQGYGYNPALEGAAGMSQQSNPYLSDDYTKAIIGNAADEMARGYATGSAAQIDSAANMDGAYGGGGWKAMHQAGQQGLEKSIGNMATQTLQDQLRFQSGAYSQDQQQKLAALGLYGNLYNSDVNNQLAANAQGAGIWNSDIGNMLSGGQLGLAASQDDWKAGEQLMNIGNFYNEYQQKLLGSQYQDWNTAQQYPAQMLDILGSALGRASGSYGSNLSTANGGGMSPLMALLGGGAAAYGMWGN